MITCIINLKIDCTIYLHTKKTLELINYSGNWNIAIANWFFIPSYSYHARALPYIISHMQSATRYIPHHACQLI